MEGPAVTSGCLFRRRPAGQGLVPVLLILIVLALLYVPQTFSPSGPVFAAMPV